MKLGLISDTHGFFDPSLETHFQGVDRILHAGDIGLGGVIDLLEVIAPVTAVLGNNDFSLSLRITELVEWHGKKLLLQHIAHPNSVTPDFSRRIQQARPHVVVFGHTHQAYSNQVGDVLFVNPGYAGAPRHGAQRSVAILEYADNQVHSRFIRLS